MTRAGRRQSRAAVCRPPGGAACRSVRGCWPARGVYCFNICWAGSAVFFRSVG
ncbi:hypothetical protein BIFBRE_03811 [Bifidobacterium breve DSM 20213 = JCM 1192]|uniref:Uncharacterized protein n=1 Tax=Bifidobacterium breve DSM 20213 = JCM 1192 TaxID=518634 RepID=D4BP03_BIFBR|nr:hypothetical protein BIFBRE_03811 [Bifidobacterium breve DSM 20213 = JCM 1192]